MDVESLPLLDDGTPEDSKRRRWRTSFRPQWLVAILALLFLGGVLGLYFQGPALRAFYRVTGLEPGGGARQPIALPLPRPEATAVASIHEVVALGRLMPRDGTITVHAPYGAGDARVARLLVTEGDEVQAGEVIAELDNASALASAVALAEANLAVRQAALRQTQALISSTEGEVRASLRRARAVAKHAATELKRTQRLFADGVATQADLDTAQTTAQEANYEVQRLSATRARYDEDDITHQADVALAQSNVTAAEAQLEQAQRDHERAQVRAPWAGTILSVNVRAGEKPTTQGVVELGDLSQMTAELEVYQTDIGRIHDGQSVVLEAAPLGPEPLRGWVTEIGLKVGRQSITRDEPAANTDARVVLVTVTLDEASSKRARRLTGLEVVGRCSDQPPMQQGDAS